MSTTKQIIWGVYWRCLLATLTVGLVTVLTAEYTGFLSQLPSSRYNPTAFWLCATAAAMLLRLVTVKGLVQVFWGQRLPLGKGGWQWVEHSFIAFFLFLALLAALVQWAVAPDVWASYKLYAQPAMLMLWPLPVSRFVLRSAGSQML